MLKIAVDAMGGDHAPGTVVEGTVEAVRDLNVSVALVGEAPAIEQELQRHGHDPRIEIVPAAESVTMHEAPTAALRKKDSSMKVAFELMKRREVDAVVSAGNSGAMMAIGVVAAGTLPQVARPAIMVVVPSLANGTIIVDAGANVECKPKHLVQFAFMGSIYAERVLGVVRPRVAVLSNGEEPSKGNDLTRAARDQLSNTSLNFIGYVEGRDIFNGKVDVIVCDGFTGNIALKTMEGAAAFAGEILKSAFQKNVSSRMGYLMSRRSLKEGYRRLDYAEYGGAPLIGLDGTAIVAHGGSNPRAIRNAIRAARDAVDHDLNRHLSEELEKIAGSAADEKDGAPRNIWQRLKSRIEQIGEKPSEVHVPEEVNRSGKA